MTTFKNFFPEILRNQSNNTFLVFADLLEEAGKNTQADLIRTSLRFRTDLTPTEQALLGVSHPLDATAFGAAMQAEHDLQHQVIAELGPEIAVLLNDPHRISFDRGIIRNLNLSRTTIPPLPEGLQMTGNLNLYGTKCTALPKGLQVGGSLFLSGPQSPSLPEDLQVGGVIDLTGTSLSPEAAARILKMPGLSVAAQLTALRTAGYPNLADQVVRQTGQAAQQTTPH